ncbi:hypothetical protein VTL71DRAFT_9674 [Oculimacula yallundae]|uniref:Uncharacterized protein n=1 Tax=Oculimacula yallundae TaxID=86028 RepID=A0ABR4BRI8_9HELO
MTSTPIESTAMDKENLQSVIVDMSKELRDQAVGDHQHETCYIKWEFRGDPDSADNSEYEPVTTNYKDNGGLPNNWEESALENLYKGLTDGRVRAFALNEEKQILGESSSRHPATKNTTKKPRVPDRLRDRLIETIETAIGRHLDSRSAKFIDPRKSDPKPPNLYKWQFSDDYPAFPDKKGGISRWSAVQIQSCYQALDKKHLIVVNVAPGSPEAIKVEVEVQAEATDLDMDSSEHEISDFPHVLETPFSKSPPSSNRATADTNIVQNITKELHPASESATDAMAMAVEDAQIKTSIVPLKGLEVAQSQILSILTTTLEDQAKQLEITWKAFHASAQIKFRKQLEIAGQQLETERIAHQKTLSNLLPLQREGEKLRTKVAQLEQLEGDLEGRIINSRTETKRVRAKLTELEQDFDRKVSAAMIEGRQSITDEIMNDFGQTMEGEHLAELGLQAGKKAAAPSSTQSSLDQADVNLESLKRQHEEDIQLARKAGRESAYMEFSLGPESSLSDILQIQAELNSNRKIRELKTMHQNWHDIPQRILPSHMLPEGHTPGDKTLYLLAKLSKEVHGVTASQMLTEEIDQRCKNNFDQPKCRIVINSDIQKVLDRIGPNFMNRSASQTSMDESQTPHPLLRSQLTVPERNMEPQNKESPERSQDTINHHNGEHPASKGKPASQRNPATASAFATPASKRNPLGASTHPLPGSMSNPPKRPNTNFSNPTGRDPKRRKTYTPSAVPARLQEIFRSEEDRDLSVEVNDSTIFADPNMKVKDVRDVEKGEAAEDDDIYDASPPRKTRSRAASKKDGALS